MRRAGIKNVAGEQHRVHMLFPDDPDQLVDKKQLILPVVTVSDRHPDMPVRRMKQYHPITPFWNDRDDPFRSVPGSH